MSEEPKTHGLQKNVAKAGHIRAMCQTPGFKILQDTLDARLKLLMKQIINIDTSPEDIQKLRAKAQVWIELEKFMKEILLTGEISSRNIMNLEAPSTKEG